MDMRATGLYFVAAVGLLGSPGPGIAALLAIGKTQGWARSLRFYAGLQIGLGIALALSGAGLVSVLIAYPQIASAMTVLATIYLLYLAFAIATSPVGMTTAGKPPSPSPVSGMLLGITNPKAYLAFASLLTAPLTLVPGHADNILIKLILTMLVILAVDIVWLWIGVTIGRARFAPRNERALNITMGSMIAIAAVLMIV
jgi:threonine/homoserine/homoserine lactone efflux protein